MRVGWNLSRASSVPLPLEDRDRLSGCACISTFAASRGPSTVELLQSPALVLENSLNPNQARREAVALWLSEAVAIAPDETGLSARIDELVEKGFKSFDAFHLASAELSGADAFLTVDGQLLKLASRVSGELSVTVSDPIRFIEEISQWRH
jgi:hypothetical protein